MKFFAASILLLSCCLLTNHSLAQEVEEIRIDNNVIPASAIEVLVAKEKQRLELVRLREVVSKLSGKAADDLSARLDAIQEKLNDYQPSPSDQILPAAKSVVEEDKNPKKLPIVLIVEEQPDLAEAVVEAPPADEATAPKNEWVQDPNARPEELAGGENVFVLDSDAYWLAELDSPPSSIPMIVETACVTPPPQPSPRKRCWCFR